MKTIRGILTFHKKIFIPCIIISIMIQLSALTTTEHLSLVPLGLGYIFSAPLFHLFNYEVRNTNEYYFYYNLGLSKIILWTSTIVISLIIGLTFSFIKI